MRRNQSVTCAAVLVAGLAAGPAWPQSPVGTAFTYQGQLKQAGVPVNGTADFEFTLWNAETDGARVGATDPHPGVGVVNGLFTAQLDFGSNAFTGDARWLEIVVTYPVGSASVPLSPRQPITPAPYALHALDAPGGGDSWALAGNAGTTPGANFVGTTDDQPLELHVGGVRALRVEPNDMSPNLIGGYRENMVNLDVVGATISGGGSGGATNRVTDEGGAIGGGKNNQAGDDSGTTIDAANATVAGGSGNTASGLRSTIGGGRNNTASGINSTVGGGANNAASNNNSTIGGGANNVVSGNRGTIAGGYFNTASGDMSTVGGGEHNTANGYLATIPGGSYNKASGTYSLATGQRAQANHTGSFVWSDSTTADPDFFSSTGVDQFLIKATGGVGINTNAPGAALHIVGPPTEGAVVQIDTVGEDATALNINATGYPGFGIVASATDTAIFGSSPIEGGTFYASGVGGRGLAGIANAATGAGKGVYGRTNSPDGYAGYFEGRGYFSGNVGIGQTIPAAKLHIGGTPSVDGIMFPDGTLQTTAALGGGGAGDGHSLDAADGNPVDALFVDNNGIVTVLSDLNAGGELTAEGEVTLNDLTSGTNLASLNRNVDGHGQLVTFADGSSVSSAVVGTDTDANGAGGLVLLGFDDALGPAVKLDSTGNAGRATLARSTGILTLDETIVMYADAPRTDFPTIFTSGGGVDLLNGNGVRTIALRGDDGLSGDGGLIMGFDGSGTRVFELDTEISSGAPNMVLEHPSGGNASQLFFTVDTGGKLAFRNAAGETTITIDSDDGNGADGDGLITTQKLAITGGSDLSERFNVRAPKGDALPGMVASIDIDRPGELIISRRPYDRTVAGIISGAGGVDPGMLMGQTGSIADGKHPVALSGRVYVFADASRHPIEPGDLLTTSSTPGHAMKVTDYVRANGAIIGKAMTRLEEGKGLVLVLVSLQ